MPYSASGKSGEYHTLVEFVLDSTTLRYADEDLSIQHSNATGFFYAGKLVGGGTLVRDLGTFVEPHESVHNLDLNIDNNDGAIANLIVDKPFANRRVRVWVGEGVKKSQYSEVFSGFVAHPNGISWDEDEASFTIIDQRIRHRRVFPASRFTAVPTIESKAKNQPIPIIYGDWGLSAGSGNGSVSVPVMCNDMISSQKRFKIADHGLHSLSTVLKNGVALNMTTQVNNSCLSTATFRIATAVAYDATLDVMSVNCKGLKTINGTLIERPMDVLRHIHTAWLGLTATDLNVTAYHNVNVSGTESEVVRRFIATEISSEQLIKELLNESQVDIRFIGGKYSPKYRDIEVDATRSAFRDVDIMLADEQSEKAVFSVVKDPDRFFANKARTYYRYDPVNTKYDGSYTRQVTTSVSEVTAIVERFIEFNWYYRTTETENRVDRELATFTKEPVNIRFKSGLRGSLLNLADQIDVTYNVFTDQPVQIRRLETDLFKMQTNVSGYNLFMFGMGRWTAAGAPAWNAATREERGSQGFWCTSNGFASAADASSQNVSRWS